ncbi:hypothetical protein DLAC_10168 [Tieghemostelium lacteum]|uniref:Exportin(tRNA) n=1 Tax=Tieghemostelium lacteum TaxID=361077 RepID=A0A151Z6A7_TIELA|nr:hypothetical protein DLAC_10168 [Tieghemostelium lacteum]|eukprot:KYQ89493.1 hypothetical protein DLAC_10168 [Tieghemostelium lacteum]
MSSSNIELLFKKIEDTDYSDLSNVLQLFLKNYCQDETTTSQHLNLFYSSMIQLQQTYQSQKDTKNLYKKSIICLGIIARYIPWVNVFENLKDKFIQEVLLASLQFDIKESKSSNDSLQDEIIKSYTLILQVFQEKLDTYSETILNQIQIEQEVNRDSIISFLSILIQVSPLLVVNRVKILEYFIQIYIDTKDSQVHEELTQFLGQFFQLYIPFKSFKVGDDEDDQDDEDDDSNSNEADRLKEIEKLGNQISVPTLVSLSKHLVQPENLNQESTLLFLGIFTAYSFIHLQEQSPETVVLLSQTYSQYLSMDNIYDKENRKQTVSILDSLRISLSNLYVVKKHCEILDQILETLFKVLLGTITSCKDYFKKNQSKGVQNLYFKVRNSVILSLGTLMKHMRHFFRFADQFQQHTGILADPLILSDFIVALVNDINSTPTESNQEKQEKLDKFKGTYLPSIVEPLLSELSKSTIKYKTVTTHIIQSLGTIIQHSQELYQDYLDETIKILEKFIQSNYTTISNSLITIIESISKILNLFGNDKIYKFDYMKSIFNIYFLILNGSSEIIVEDQDEEEEEEVGKLSNLDSDIISKILFTILESIFNSFKNIRVRLESSDGQLILEDIYSYLIEKMKEEVIFDADRYVRMMQLDLINEVYTFFGDCVEFLGKSLPNTIKQFVKELLMIQYQIEIGEEQEFNNQRLEICLKGISALGKRSTLDSVKLLTIFKESIQELNQNEHIITTENIEVSKKLIFK